MAADFITTEEGIKRVTGLVPTGDDFTQCWYAYIPAIPAPGTWITLFERYSAVSNGISYLYGSTGNLEGNIYLGSGPTSDAMGTGWRFLTYTYEHATGEHNMYVDAVLSMTDTLIMDDGDPMIWESIGTLGDTFAATWDPSKAAYVKQWNRLLTLAEIEDQMLLAAPVSADSLWLDTPLGSDLDDYSGNGRDWSEEDGTITFAAGPSLPALDSDAAIWALDEGGAADTDPTDGVDDAGTAYAASLVTRPYPMAHLINQFGVKSAALVARAAAGVTLDVTVLSDYTKATKTAAGVALTPVIAEEHVIKKIDNLSLSEVGAAQFKFADPVTPIGRWDLSMFAVRLIMAKRGP